MLLITGGAGFIGTNFLLDWLAHTNEKVVNVDKLTYAGNFKNVLDIQQDSRHIFACVDINDQPALHQLFLQHRPRAVLHFAAESHVDRSIDNPLDFVQTNVVGTFALLEVTRTYWQSLTQEEQQQFRFLHISTDEVYGSLHPDEPPFSEHTPYAPNSPYAASKASSDHLVRAYHYTYGLPTLTVHGSNNYGPYQFPEKLIPLMITNALAGKPLSLYGDGQNVRDWLYVKDHCAAIRQVLAHGRCGETYNIGGGNQKTNLEVVHLLCTVLDQIQPKSSGSYAEQIVFVKDRLGHDRRYAIDATKIKRELGWQAAETFATGMAKTVQWYVAHPEWVQNMISGAYQQGREALFA